MRKRYDENDGIFLIVFLGIFVTVAIFSYIFDKRRKDKIKEYCRRNGFVYTEDPPPISAYAEPFNLFSNNGHSIGFYSNMHKKIGDIEIDVVDYQYTTGYRKHKTTHTFTVCQFCSPNAFFPQFFMRDENKILDTLGSLLGGQDVDFMEDKEFSSKFVLQGINEGDLRSFFKAKVRKTFSAHHMSGFKYEGISQYFIIYCNNFANIEKRMLMIERGLKIFRVIAQEAPTNSESPLSQDDFGNQPYAANPFSNPNSYQNFKGF